MSLTPFIRCIVCVCLMALAPVAVAAPDTSELSAVAEEWMGFSRWPLDTAGLVGHVTAPRTAAAGKPWLWYESAVEWDTELTRALLSKGFHVARVSVEPPGAVLSAEALSGVYASLVSQLGLAASPALRVPAVAGSCLVHWAAANATDVACLLVLPDAQEGEAAPEHATDDALDGLVGPLGAAQCPVLHAGVSRGESSEGRRAFAAYRRGGRGPYAIMARENAEAALNEGERLHLLYYLLKHTGQIVSSPVNEKIAGAPAWRVAPFSGHTAVYALDDVVIIEEGEDMTGIVWAATPPRNKYEITLEAMRIDGGDFFCGLTAPYGDTVFSLIIGGWGGTCVGISSLDWLDAYHNETARFMSFASHRWYPVRLRVSDARIQAWIEGEQVVDISVADRDVDIRWEMGPTKPLGVATWRTTGALRNFQLRPL